MVSIVNKVVVESYSFTSRKGTVILLVIVSKHRDEFKIRGSQVFFNFFRGVGGSPPYECLNLLIKFISILRDNRE